MLGAQLRKLLEFAAPLYRGMTQAQKKRKGSSLLNYSLGIMMTSWAGEARAFPLPDHPEHNTPSYLLQNTQPPFRGAIGAIPRPYHNTPPPYRCFGPRDSVVLCTTRS